MVRLKGGSVSPSGVARLWYSEIAHWKQPNRRGINSPTHSKLNVLTLEDARNGIRSIRMKWYGLHTISVAQARRDNLDRSSLSRMNRDFSASLWCSRGARDSGFFNRCPLSMNSSKRIVMKAGQEESSSMRLFEFSSNVTIDWIHQVCFQKGSRFCLPEWKFR